LDGKPGPFVQQLAAAATDSLPEKWPRLLKELNRSVKQKNPKPEKRIKIPAENKSQDRRRLAKGIHRRAAPLETGVSKSLL